MQRTYSLDFYGIWMACTFSVLYVGTQSIVNRLYVLLLHLMGWNLSECYHYIHVLNPVLYIQPATWMGCNKSVTYHYMYSAL